VGGPASGLPHGRAPVIDVLDVVSISTLDGISTVDDV
jgi:hypothetical protein